MNPEAATPRSYPRAFVYALPVLLFLAIAALLFALVLPVPNRSAAKNDADPNAFNNSNNKPVPSFSFTERNGHIIKTSDLVGKVWVASFVFTRCTGPCPSVTATMARVQQELKLAENDHLRLVTFTLDPETDTPDELKKYAESRKAHPDRWLFLTGPEAEIHKLAKETFYLGVTRNATPSGPGDKFDHTTYLAVVDRHGRVRGHFSGYQGKMDEDGSRFATSYDRMKTLIQQLIDE